MIYIVDIENIPTRYTSQWKTWIPDSIEKEGLEYTVIDGVQDEVEKKIGTEAFFDFNQTAKYKATQIQKISELFIKNKVEDGDVFLFTDAWHPGVIQLRQILLFNNVDVKLYGMWHAGSYDSADLLGQKGQQFFLDFERSVFNSLDMSFYATDFSRNLMVDTLNLDKKKSKVTGFPYALETLNKYVIDINEKENIILFPHRVSIEKHPELFEKLSKRFPDYEFIVTLDVCPDKKSFYELMARAKYIISFAEQETWGISVFEAIALCTIPIVPDKLSYKEMYTDDIKYVWEDDDLDINVDRVEKKIRELDALCEYERFDINRDNYERLDSFCTFDNILEVLI